MVEQAVNQKAVSAVGLVNIVYPRVVCIYISRYTGVHTCCIQVYVMC